MDDRTEVLDLAHIVVARRRKSKSRTEALYLDIVDLTHTLRKFVKYEAATVCRIRSYFAKVFQVWVSFDALHQLVEVWSVDLACVEQGVEAHSRDCFVCADFIETYFNLSRWHVFVLVDCSFVVEEVLELLRS